MAIGIAAATTTGATNHFEVCPMWENGACACPHQTAEEPVVTEGDLELVSADAAPQMKTVELDELVTPHPAFDFSAASPDARTGSAWAEACAIEALRLVEAVQVAAVAVDAPQLADKVMASLVGLTL